MQVDFTSLDWHTEQRRISDLIPWTKNPRRMTDKQASDLRTSLERLNLMSIPVVDLDNTIISGHQRMKIMQLLGRGEEIIDVRVPNRKLTDDEFKEANIRENKNLGEWNFDLLAENFEPCELEIIGFSDEELKDIFQLEMPPLEEDPKEKEVDENLKTDNTCPKCGYVW